MLLPLLMAASQELGNLDERSTMQMHTAQPTPQEMTPRLAIDAVLTILNSNCCNGSYIRSRLDSEFKRSQLFRDAAIAVLEQENIGGDDVHIIGTTLPYEVRLSEPFKAAILAILNRENVSIPVALCAYKTLLDRSKLSEPFRVALLAILRRTDINDYFVGLYYRDMPYELKRSPEVLAVLLGKVRSRYELLALVGALDTHHIDQQMEIVKQLSPERCDYLTSAERPEELSTLIKYILRRIELCEKNGPVLLR